MAPPKLTSISQNKQNSTAILMRTGVTTRNKSTLLSGNPLGKPPIIVKDVRMKRKAEVSPMKEKTTKRSALGNITNAIGKSLGAQLQDHKKVATKRVTIGAKSTVTTAKAAAQVITAQTLIKTTAAHALTRSSTAHTQVKQVKQEQPVPSKSLKPLPRVKQIKEEEKKILPTKSRVSDRGLEPEKSDESSLYVSALEEVSDDSAKKVLTDDSQVIPKEKIVEPLKKVEEEPSTSTDEEKKEEKEEEKKVKIYGPPKRKLPDGVQWDFDAENWQDPFQVSPYAMDIFNYLKEREDKFPIGDYMQKQVCLSKWMRSMLVDWMVEVQESFELNHETLYLAVKLVDLYLSQVVVGKETLQLLGAASLFIASKFDERIPPMVEDFLYICDGAYSQRDLIRMEINILKVIDFDLGIPLSYRFLRRYARCAKVSMPTLTLARYILEYSLMDYATIRFSDSKMAAAALFLALNMKDLGGWNRTLEYYTGYELNDIKDVVLVLNEGLHRKQKEALSTIRNKYSHKIFFEVAKVPLKNVIDL